MDEIIQIGLRLKQLEEFGELRIVYIDNLGAKAMVMTNTERFCIAIDPSLSYEQQVREIWHEAKHIYSHLNTACSLYTAEKEAEEFSNIASKHPEILMNLRGQ